ncbi:MAG: hypothetical protein LC781_10755 [Actinobacteria bacterium]|nr:hypothetical protein [Actinomycetota bacterium]MDQ3303839.1 hypothetical protein [Actinomycetota bacterium]
MREEEIMQITPALWGWYAYGQDELVGVRKPQGPRGVRSHRASSFAGFRHAFMGVVSYVLRSADFPGFVT